MIIILIYIIPILYPWQHSSAMQRGSNAGMGYKDRDPRTVNHSKAILYITVA